MTDSTAPRDEAARGKDSRAVVERFLAAAAAGDAASLEALAHPELRVLEAASLPFGGEHVGVAGFRALARRVFGCWRGTRLAVDRVLADGEAVVVLARLLGTSRTDGAAVEIPVAEIWELDGGRVRTIRPYYHDTHRLLQTLAPARAEPLRDVT